MKIAFDFDDVITCFPEFWVLVIKSLISTGNEIVILTDIDPAYKSQRLYEMKCLGIEACELAITSAKKKYCIDNNIKYAIDDTLDYYSSTPINLVGIFKINN